MGDNGDFREEFTEEYTNGGLIEVNKKNVKEAKEHFRELFGDKQTLKWTLLLAFRGGFYKHNLNSYYPTASDDNLANYHRKYFKKLGLIVEIKERQFRGDNWEEERRYLRSRRDPDIDMEDFHRGDIVFNETVPDGQIRKLVSEISKGESSNKDERDYFNTGNSQEWIFLTPLGEEVLKGMFGSGVSLSLPLRAAAESEYNKFLYCLPKLTKIGDNRYLPNLYQFALDDTDITDYSEKNDRNVIPKNKISKKIISSTEGQNEVTALFPWLPNDRACEHIRDGNFNKTIVIGERLTNKYRRGDSDIRQRINENLLFRDEISSIEEADLPEDVDFRSFENPLPYILVHSRSSSQKGKLLINPEGDEDEPRGPLLTQTDETDRPTDLYSWAADLCESLKDESIPLKELSGG